MPRKVGCLSKLRISKSKAPESRCFPTPFRPDDSFLSLRWRAGQDFGRRVSGSGSRVSGLGHGFRCMRSSVFGFREAPESKSHVMRPYSSNPLYLACTSSSVVPHEVALATQVALYKAECGEETDACQKPQRPSPEAKV